MPSLLESGASVHESGPLGTPLFCALVGHQVLAVGASPDSWSDVLHGDARLPRRHAAVRRILGAGSNCSWRFQWSDGRKASLAGLAFWFSCLVNDYSVFEQVLKGGAVVDDDFATLIADEGLLDRAEPYDHTLAVALTCALDSTYMDGRNGDWPWYRPDSVLDAIDGVTGMRRLGFARGLGSSRRLPNVTDETLPVFVRAAILDDEGMQLRRLSMDPRFNPNQPASKHDAAEGTIAHLAVAGDKLDAVDALVAAVSSFAARDGQGRTPLMLVEGVDMLAKLVDLGLPTVDTDAAGRNIWHLAAATRDVPLFEWLTAHDPSKERNLAAVSAE